LLSLCGIFAAQIAYVYNNIMTKAINNPSLKVRLRRVARLHYLYIIAIVTQLILYDAGKLIEPIVVLRRWAVLALLIFVVAVVWYWVQKKNTSQSTLQKLAFMLIATDIFVASFHVYIQRGMASKAVLLFVIPLIVAACLQRKSALIATSLICIAVYSLTAVAYFVLNFNEGYKLELYGEVGFYSAILLLISFALWIVARPNQTRIKKS
jgi:hypothetical protein